ncbi:MULTISPECIES: NUDIX hydrolase [unclassified Frankia]|uniref:NUDIX hydrolase n=1 Tax=unclassified Frankia TaxID=2632575 RepID=UPI0027DDEB94|nr:MULTISPECIES: NUDIX hydrolase [unclassified Frankia]
MDDDSRILIVQPTYRPGWDLPGGVVEQEESPHSAALQHPADELAAWTFAAIDQLPGLMVPLLARRIAACLAARTTGKTAYLEDGTPPR